MTSPANRDVPGTTELGKEPVPLKGVDLSFLHAPPAPPPGHEKAPEPPDDTDASSSAESPGQDVDSPGQDAAAGEQDVASEDLEKAKPIIAYVPAKLRDRLKKTATATGRSYTDVLFDAVDELDSRLAEVFAEHLAAAPSNSLFSRRSRRATTSRPASGPSVQVPFRPYPADLAVLDDRATTYAAGNRSEFIRIVLQAYLP